MPPSPNPTEIEGLTLLPPSFSHACTERRQTPPAPPPPLLPPAHSLPRSIGHTFVRSIASKLPPPTERRGTLPRQTPPAFPPSCPLPAYLHRAKAIVCTGRHHVRTHRPRLDHRVAVQVHHRRSVRGPGPSGLLHAPLVQAVGPQPVAVLLSQDL